MLFVNMCTILSRSDLQRIFEKLDKNGDGFVSLEELNWLLQRIGNNFECYELESLVEKKSLDFNEFLHFFYNSITSKQQKKMIMNNEEEDSSSSSSSSSTVTAADHHQDDELESDLVETFKVFDLDGDGFITSQELECILKRLGLWDDGKDCKTMIRFYDTNLDGRLDFQEFKNMMFLT